MESPAREVNASRHLWQFCYLCRPASLVDGVPGVPTLALAAVSSYCPFQLLLIYLQQPTFPLNNLVKVSFINHSFFYYDRDSIRENECMHSLLMNVD